MNSSRLWFFERSPFFAALSKIFKGLSGPACSTSERSSKPFLRSQSSTSAYGHLQFQRAHERTAAYGN